MNVMVQQQRSKAVRHAPSFQDDAKTPAPSPLPEPHAMRMFAALSVLYAVAVLTLSHLKLLWLDELITLHIARLGSAGAIWHALSQGADPNPPVTHLLVHACLRMFGEHEYALRFPAMFAYWVGMLCLYLYLKRHVPAQWALAGTVLSMTMAAFDYSFESRSYAIFYGCAMAAFYCWTVAVSPGRTRRARNASLLGMVLALAVGISANYFAVLAFLPIAGGECVRLWSAFRKRQASQGTPRAGFVPDLSVWLMLLLAATPLLVYRPMIEHSIAQFAPHAWNKVSLGQVADSYTEMVEIILYPLLALLVCAGLVRGTAALYAKWRGPRLPKWFSSIVARSGALAPLVPPHERVGIFLLMAYPILGYIVASIRGGMMSPRFVIPVCFGFSIAGCLVAYRLFGGFRRSSLTILCFLLAWFVARESFVGYWYAEQKQCFYKVLDRIPVADMYAPGGVAIAVPDPLMALTLQHYAPRAIAERIVFPIDFPAIRNFRGDDSPEQNLWAGRTTIYNMNITPLARLQRNRIRYLILASDDNWLLRDLDHHHYQWQRLPINTRAGAIGGFTPLARGVPSFYTGTGTLMPVGPLVAEALPVPFEEKANLPDPSYP